MADKRINALATTAPNTASDDFIAIDGTTNGTRKLNAFSPTFGGNATVTGTLTVNGGATTINGNASGTTSYARFQNNGSSIALLGSRAAIDSGTATDVGLFVYGANELSFWTNSTRSAWISSGGVFNTVAGAAVGGALSVSSTTASTTTSTGALVVSGGVGVGGNINAGGTTFRLNSKLFGVGDGTTTYLYSQGSGGFILRNAADSADIFRITNAGVTSIVDTTASTSTSSGALVVSGGVGVAGAVNAGTFYGLVDGVTAPGTESGYARIYVDSADGDLKVKFGDGTVKTIATDS